MHYGGVNRRPKKALRCALPLVAVGTIQSGSVTRILSRRNEVYDHMPTDYQLQTIITKQNLQTRQKLGHNQVRSCRHQI